MPSGFSRYAAQPFDGHPRRGGGEGERQPDREQQTSEAHPPSFGTVELPRARCPHVAQVSKPAVSPTSMSADGGFAQHSHHAGLETCDTADSEVCATGLGNTPTKCARSSLIHGCCAVHVQAADDFTRISGSAFMFRNDRTIKAIPFLALLRSVFALVWLWVCRSRRSSRTWSTSLSLGLGTTPGRNPSGPQPERPFEFSLRPPPQASF